MSTPTMYELMEFIGQRQYPRSVHFDGSPVNLLPEHLDHLAGTCRSKMEDCGIGDFCADDGKIPAYLSIIKLNPHWIALGINRADVSQVTPSKSIPAWEFRKEDVVVSGIIISIWVRVA